MIDAETLLSSLSARGIEVAVKGENLLIEPASKLTDEDRAALRENKAEIIALRTMPPLGAICFFDLAALTEAIADAPRSPIENDLAMARFARAAVRLTTLIRQMGKVNQGVALMEMYEAAAHASRLIRRRQYESAYRRLDALIAELESKRFH